ncbi:hypothetical protein CspHIS471_0106090 [Cutaneotrichosporon sp. HIS471]|nr:hypothetical protein CspHIS471_0106090 [Cutaneotrichosporon sp. HIS471]
MSGFPVQLYVYDLSRGMARSMSLALTGKQLDGIWHTSVVVFGREIFYGRGIMEAAPGTTHHGTPVQVIECGDTHIDDNTFQEYLLSLSDLYTPSAYHLIEFNCNNFTADVIGFLTGTTTPAWITGLPAEFLSTPLGQALKPSIDQMFQGSNPNEHSAFRRDGPSHSSPLPPQPSNPNPNPQDLASMLLGAVAQQAAGSMGPNGANPPRPQASNPETSPLTLVTSFANWTSILKNHRAVVANFTNTEGCPPCRMIKPAYEAMAETYAASHGAMGVRFVEIEMGIGEGQNIASQYSVRATPTFIFFKDGVKVDEMAGADKRGLETRIESFLEDVFPRHPHEKIYLAATSKLSTQPITQTAAPGYPALLKKLESFPNATKAHVDVLRADVVPFLEGKAVSDVALPGLVDKWTAATTALLGSLKPAETFPLIDLWRVGLTNTRLVSALVVRLGPNCTSAEPLVPILSLTSSQLASQGAATPRPLLLTTLRLSTNALAPLPLANLVLSGTLQEPLVSVLVESLLHTEVSVRKAAADVAVNAAAWRHRAAKESGQAAQEGPEPEWEVELLSALLESIGREADPDVGHRLLVASALLIYLSPGYEDTVAPLLEVLGARTTLLDAGKRWAKADVRKLADEVATKLCP